MSRRAVISTRRARAAESFQTASECIGTIEPGLSLFALTRGQFSMIDVILACLDQTGPAAVSCWTWTVAEYEVQVLARMRCDQRIIKGTLIIDHGARDKNAHIIKEWRDRFGFDSVRYVVNHAKIATIENDRFKILARGSMNLNFNPRFEQFDLTEGGPDFDLIKQVEAELPVLPDNASGKDVVAASKITKCFDQQKLALFETTKVWSK